MNSDDVPVYLRNHNGEWIIGFGVTVTPNGKNHGCQIEKSSGLPELDAYTCGLVVKRARFKPATATSGQPVFGVYRAYTVYRVADEPLPPDYLSAPTFSVSVPILPHGIKPRPEVRLMFSVAPDGAMSSCTEEPSRSTPKANRVLVPVACDHLLKDYTAIPTRDERGKVVLSVQDAIVAFRKQ
jgi:hypothetical protein